MPGTRVEGNWPGYVNCTSWGLGIWNSQDFPDWGMKTYSIIHPRGQGVWKLPGNLLRGMKLFRSNLRNATFRTCVVKYTKISFYLITICNCFCHFEFYYYCCSYDYYHEILHLFYIYFTYIELIYITFDFQIYTTFILRSIYRVFKGKTITVFFGEYFGYCLYQSIINI